MGQLLAPGGSAKKNAWFTASLCHEPDGRTDGHHFLGLVKPQRTLLEELVRPLTHVCSDCRIPRTLAKIDDDNRAG